MRAYDIAVAALAIDAPPKWTDNALSHFHIDGVVASQRGVARKIPHASLIVLAVARALHVELGMSVRDAVMLAPDLLYSPTDGVPRSGHLRVTLDRPALELEVARRLRDALESAPATRRGRPPGRRAPTP